MTSAERNLLYAIILANDPHRTIALPSLRYLVHLVGPGWNVIGAGEHALPGVAAGHNERVGDVYTVNNTYGQNFRQNHGASFREILDVSDWDRSVATKVPGQSGQPGSKHYGDLLPMWAEGKYFPLLYSRQKVEAMAKHRLTLESAR